MGFFFNDDNRININFSKFAWKVINEDMFSFYNDQDTNLSTIVNDIIENFYYDAKSSIKIRLELYSPEIEAILKAYNPTTYFDLTEDFCNVKAIEYLNFVKTLQEKGLSKKIKLRKELADYLRNDCTENQITFYNHQVGIYLKSIIEEYCRLPFIKRERIIFNKNYRIIKEAIHNKKQLVITVSSGKEFYAMPYKLVSDKLNIFNYLIAVNPEGKHIAAYRISHATLRLSHKPSKFDKKLINNINNTLAQNDVMFLTKDKVAVTVEFNDFGLNRLKNQLHMRPLISKKINEHTYEFDCTLDQAKFYFYKFGSSAKIISPERLALSFKHFYSYALEQYKDIPELEQQ